ncbi:predicted protein [Chaetoceros tenuissimus]|uniref:Uncharacterized protein n=1 Tax=Chaetoceros tenuissimus TaxID=426638 RepID=A0AAD3H792_9STRA|nr:predicted protein [Chaetoceros tenuissimus]
MGERHLSTACATFEYAGPDTTDAAIRNDPTNWISTSGGTTTSLAVFCHKDAHDCCRSGDTGDVNDQSECASWSTNVAYTICGGSCKDGLTTCSAIANKATGGSVTLNQGACSGGSSVCTGIGGLITDDVDIEVGTGACTSNFYGICYNIAGSASNLKSIKIPKYECQEFPRCIACGMTSTFDGIFVPTDACCGLLQGDRTDVACNNTPPPEEPNPCKNVNCGNRGKCQVLSFTEAECQCENTFIQSGNKLDCICDSNHEFNANANRCFPITKAPSKSPTFSPSLTSSASPSQVATTKEDLCEDDENATFELINFENEFRHCSWITKNWKKRAIRKEKYCVLDAVKAKCPESCGICSK